MEKFSYIEIRKMYIDFMKKNMHQEIPNSPLVPENDPSVLFVNAGMFPLVPFLLGENHPLGTRLTNVQRCIRTGDIDDVGDPTHNTAFEMLGNWSLNDYFKDEAIRLTVQFYVQEVGLDINKIYGSVFGGGKIGETEIERDDTSIKVWEDIFKGYGIDAKYGKGERIQPFVDKNWWGLPGGGPCGPCSEIFYDTGKEACGSNCNINCNCGKFVEIGNNVFMHYLKESNGNIKTLGRHNVDFGGGLVRIVALLQGVDSVYETDIFKPIYDNVKSLSVNQIEESQRVITDHLNSAAWIVMDGVMPARNQQGYILRRLIRRAVRHGKKLGVEGLFTRQVVKKVVDQFGQIYPELISKSDFIQQIIEDEEIKFNKTIKNGINELEKIARNHISAGLKIFENEDGISFKIYETYGFPPELFIEELENRNVNIDTEKFWLNHNATMEKHQELSRTASKGMFKGGLADTSEISTKYHTAQHLLLASMRKILGNTIVQKGSNITTERLRFDFPAQDRIDDAKIIEIENMVNKIIGDALPVNYTEMPKTDALKKVDIAMFSDRYPDIVKVYTVGDPENPFSREICTGPHVDNTSKLGKFKIVKQENVGAGIRRIKAVLE